MRRSTPPPTRLYAARFLNTLYGGSGSWVQATAAYHSQTPAIGADYQQRVMARWDHQGPATIRRARDTDGVSQLQGPRHVYGAFRPTELVYGDFAGPVPVPTRLAHR